MRFTMSATGIVYLQVELNSLNSEKQRNGNVIYVKSGHFIFIFLQVILPVFWIIVHQEIIWKKQKQNK